MLSKELLSHVLDIGEQMLVSGAEINRVEDSITRICRAYEAIRVDVFTITSSIVVTLQMKSGNTLTQTRRIFKYSTDLDRLDKLNSLSRYICAHTPEPRYIDDQLAIIKRGRRYSARSQYAIYGMIAASFTVFFGGDMADCLASGIIGIFLRGAISLARRVDRNAVIVSILSSFAVGMMGILFIGIGLGHHLDKMMIGNIMLLIPGLALTNSIRDLISEDTIAGLLRLCEALLIALSISLGFAFASIVVGGMFK